MKVKNIPKMIIKAGLQYFAAHFGPHTRKYSESKLIIMMYHRVLPDGDERLKYEEPGMRVSPETFKQNLQLLAKYFKFIHMSEWLERKEKKLPLPEKACVITFDDGWADNYEFAYPILKELQVPATIFVVANMIDSNKVFWPERLARMLHAITKNHSEQWAIPSLQWLRTTKTTFTYANIPPTTEEISQITAHIKQYNDDDIHRKLDIIEQELSFQKPQQNAALLNWEQINEMNQNGLIEIGSHTCNHIRLSDKIPTNIVKREVEHSKKIIDEKTKKNTKTFCFPNGDFSTESLKLAKDNYIGVVTTQRGWNTTHSNPHLLKRIGVHEDIANHPTAFLARISGWL